MTTLQIIGGGRMGGALLEGLLAAGWAEASDLAVVEVDPEARDELSQRHPQLLVRDQPLAGADALVAVKPHLVAEVCRKLATVGADRVLSIAAGVTLASLEAVLPPGTRVVRAMPNTPALVGAGAAAVTGGTAAEPADVKWATGILRAVGEVVVVPESQLDAVTGLSGSGPAYVLLFLEAMVDAGVTAGLPRAAAESLARATLLGTARMVVETGTPPVDLRAGVTTPGGTTAAGIRVLEQRAVRAAVIDAVAAATERSRQLAAPADR
jgi:pyrroline-5-carboxylate reductase